MKSEVCQFGRVAQSGRGKTLCTHGLVMRVVRSNRTTGEFAYLLGDLAKIGGKTSQNDEKAGILTAFSGKIA